MDMDAIKAKFSQLTAKQGKTTITFELDEACVWALPDLVGLAGAQVLVTIEDPQQRIDFGKQEEEPTAFGGLLPEQAKAFDVEVEDAEVEDAEEAIPA